MIRRIPVHKLLPGMYVVNLHKSWLQHDIWQRRFKIRDAAHIRMLNAQGIHEVSIDTELGVDIPELTPSGRINKFERAFLALPKRLKTAPRPVSLGEERRRANRLLNEAGHSLNDLMLAAQAGSGVDVARLEPVLGKMIESVRRNPDALVPLARLKQMDAYAADHAVASAGLIIALAQQQGLSDAEVEKLALGTLLKDIGQAALDEHLMSKPGMLSQAEFSVVKSHVEEGLAVLDATSCLAETSVAVILEHHERYNGGGYPYQMVGEDISMAGRMAAIVDTYDAMTSDRPYRPAISPAIAVRQLFEQGGDQFDPSLVAAFVRTVGIYPVGTLVSLESGHLAVVNEVHHENLLCPVVRVIFHARRRQYVAPVEVDLARKVGNHYGQIVGVEDYARWGISPLRWQPA